MKKIVTVPPKSITLSAVFQGCDSPKSIELSKEQVSAVTALLGLRYSHEDDLVFASADNVVRSKRQGNLH